MSERTAFASSPTVAGSSVYQADGAEPATLGIIHEFVPAAAILRVAEAVLRVFKQYGDYEHKQRNRMKFMIKELGWDNWLVEYRRQFAACSAEVPLLDIDSPAAEAHPTWGRTPAPAPASRTGPAPVRRIPIGGACLTPVPSGHPAADLFAFGHGQTPQGATRWVALDTTGLEHEGPDRRAPFAQPAGDQPQRLPLSPPCPDLVLFCC